MWCLYDVNKKACTICQQPAMAEIQTFDRELLRHLCFLYGITITIQVNDDKIHGYEWSFESHIIYMVRWIDETLE